MKVSERIVETLERNGIGYIFGLPGEEMLPMLDAISGSKIKFILVHDERSAAFMANMVGRLTGKPGVVMTTLGPGAANLLPGISQSDHLGIPLLAISAQKSISGNRSRNFQNIDIVEIYDNICKRSVRLDNPETVEYELSDLIKRSMIHRRGPVLIEIPEDVSNTVVEETSFDNSIKIQNSMPEPSAIDRVLQLIKNSRSPLIMIGNLPVDESLFASIRDFIIQSDIKFFNTPLGKAMSDEYLEQYIGCAYAPDDPMIARALKQADLVLVLGHDIYENSPQIKGNIYKRVVNINYTPSQIERNYLVDVDLVGDIGYSMSYLTQLFEISDFDDEIYEAIHQDKIRANVKSIEKGSEYDKKVDELVEFLSERNRSDSMLILDNGQYKRNFSRLYTNRTAGGFLLDNSLATMGGGIAGGIAAKLLYPEREVNVVIGDGGLMMSMSDLAVVVREQLAINIFIINDGRYEMILRKQLESKMAKTATSFDAMDIEKVAGSFGLEYMELVDYQKSPGRGDNAKVINVSI